MGGDTLGEAERYLIKKFQSTPPVWVVTRSGQISKRGPPISIHTTRVGGDAGTRVRRLDKSISIHTTRVGGDGFKYV